MNLPKIADWIDEQAYQHFKHAMKMNNDNDEYYRALNRSALLKSIAFVFNRCKDYSYYKRFDDETNYDCE
jgi:hypothetical protein